MAIPISIAVGTMIQPASLAPHDLNDAGNADLLVAYADGNLKYVPEIDLFHVYRDGRWHRDEHGLMVRALAVEAIRDALDRHKRDGGPFYEKRLRHLERSLNKGPISAMIHLAKSRIAVPLARLDADDLVMGVHNGALDLVGGRLIDNARDYFITRRADVVFESQATAPLWQRVFADAFGGNTLMADYVEGIFGNMLSGYTGRQEFYVLIGDGANGKSTVVSVLATIMGDYARSILPNTLFERQSGEAGNYDLGMLPGVRLAVAHEAESRLRLHGARLKQLTGGDEIAARPIRGQPITFKPKCKVVMVANKRPNVDAYDEALKRRVRIIRFPNQVPEERRDRDLVRKLLEERSGILNRLIRAGKRFRDNQIAVPPSVLEATQTYFADMDHVAAFLDERTEKQQGVSVAKADLHTAYVAWCATECLTPLGMSELTRVLKRKGHEEVRSNKARGWKDLHLLPAAPAAKASQGAADA